MVPFEKSKLRPSAFQTRVMELEARGVELASQRAAVAEEVSMLLEPTPALIDFANHAKTVERVQRTGCSTGEKATTPGSH